ncbi:S8 family peptidase [Bacillus sp. 1P06AnD]|uniref:S8 family peptidase n=1 Tax=Bacillus sp. 1P06AnD TaxID=3132208 RepID=UPI0039A2B676
MKKGMKQWAAAGCSTVLVASMALPSAALAKEEKSNANVKSTSSIVQSLKKQDQKEKEKYSVSDNSFIIKYSSPLSAAEHRAAGGTVKRQIADLHYAEITVKNKKDLAKVMKTYSKLGKIKAITPSYIYKKLEVAPDPKANLQYQHGLLHSEAAQKLAGKNKVTVAVIDTGIDKNHPDLKKNLLPGYNAANPANQPVAGDHGTHVAGIIAAEKGNGIGGYGMAPNVKILPIDVFDGGYGASDAAIADAILYAVSHGAKVINMSLGGYGSTPILEDAVKTAIKKGVVVVAAAGNENTDDVSTPAGYEGVISVGSVNSDKKLSSYSNYGPSVDVVAPGEEVYSSLYDYEKKSTYTYGSGTSMASPVVAGAVALLKTKYPNLTPAQVEYVLEKTAEDLGAKGFDTKYANGLINIVKAMSYNVKNIPSYVKNSYSGEEALKSAEAVDGSKKIVKEAVMTKPFEQKWIKFDVKKDQYIQTLLKGSKQYDYKLMVRFYGKDGKVEEKEVNDTQDGSVEAKLLKAPFDGTVAIGVKDVNGSYDDSSKKASAYTLTVETADKLPEDETSVSKMINLKDLPYKTPTPFTIAGEGGDYDYFTFKLTEKQMVKIDMSGIPGLNAGIDVYNITSLFDGQSLSEEEKAAQLKEVLEGEEGYSGDFSASAKSKGKGASLTFVAEPEQEYVIKVSGDKTSDNWLFEMLAAILGISLSNVAQDEEKPSSLLPYTLNVQTKAVQEDEDGLDEESLYSGEASETTEQEELDSSISNKMKSAFSAFSAAEADSYLDQQTNMVDKLLQNGRPFKVGDTSTGYLQSQQDLDYFVIEPTESAIVKFKVANKDGVIPAVSIGEITDEKDENGDRYASINSIGQNLDFSGSEPASKDYVLTGLQKGKKYVIEVSHDWETGNSVSVEPYEISAENVVMNPQDKYEPNDEANAVKLPGNVVKANFAMPNDVDSYYYTAVKDGIKAITLQAGKPSKELLGKYPQELLSQVHPIGIVYEDTNKNHKVDYDKDVAITEIQKGPLGFTSASFNVKKGKSYIFQTSGYMVDDISFSMVPYTMTFADMGRKDESTSSKPIKMNKGNGMSFNGTGYLNTGVTGGDDDWFTFELAKNAKGTITLATGKEGDGVLDIYQNGKLIKHSDSYLQNDDEIVSVNLKKGKYQVKVSDAAGVASITPYKVKVDLK